MKKKSFIGNLFLGKTHSSRRRHTKHLRRQLTASLFNAGIPTYVKGKRIF